MGHWCVWCESRIAMAGTPVARLSPIKAPPKALPYGLLKGKLKLRAGFDDPLLREFGRALRGVDAPLLDTHIFLRLATDDQKAKPALRTQVESASDIYVSATTVR